METIDAHNQSLIFALNALFAPSGHRDPGADLCDRIEQTILFLARGHVREEAVMAASAYPECRRHKEEHQAFLVRLRALKHNAAAADHPDPHMVYRSLSGWAERHIEAWDKPLAEYLRNARTHRVQFEGPETANGESS